MNITRRFCSSLIDSHEVISSRSTREKSHVIYEMQERESRLPQRLDSEVQLTRLVEKKWNKKPVCVIMRLDNDNYSTSVSKLIPEARSFFSSCQMFLQFLRPRNYNWDTAELHSTTAILSVTLFLDRSPNKSNRAEPRYIRSFSFQFIIYINFFL